MSEPLKKPTPNPESHSPKDVPEILRMAAQTNTQGNLESATALPLFKGGTPMKPADFDFRFSGFRDLDFTNCFTSVYTFLENLQGEVDIDRHLHMFDTVSGRSASVRGWGNVPTPIFNEIYDTEEMIEFLMGYVGYAYERHTSDLMAHIRASIDGNVPVLARLKKDGTPYLDGQADSFRVLTGCDGGKLQMPEANGAQNKPKKAPKLSEIDSVYVITGRTARKYTLLDGLRRIKRVMDVDREAGVWDEYIHAFEGYWERLKGLGIKELKRLFEYAHAGTTWNCHNFGAAFRTHEYLQPVSEQYQNAIWDEFKDPRFQSRTIRAGRPDDVPLFPKTLIDWASDQSHTRQWQLHALYETRDWSKKYYDQMEWGTCETAALLLQKIKECDDYLYQAVCGMIGILEE